MQQLFILCWICVSVSARTHTHTHLYIMYSGLSTQRLSVCTVGLRQGFPPPSSQSSAPSSFAAFPSLARPSLALHLSIHLSEGFTLLTVKFTHIHNYVFNQSRLRAGWLRAFSGTSRRSKSSLGGASGPLPSQLTALMTDGFLRMGAVRFRRLLTCNQVPWACALPRILIFWQLNMIADAE